MHPYLFCQKTFLRICVEAVTRIHYIYYRDFLAHMGIHILFDDVNNKIQIGAIGVISLLQTKNALPIRHNNMWPACVYKPIQ